MAGKKKTNYISYELKKLDSYIEQLQDFLDKNPPNLAVDRIERIEGARGTSIRVIASIEDQVRSFTSTLEKLPKMLEDLNRLRKELDQDKKEVELRGGASRPGFMDDEEDEEEEHPRPKKKGTKSEKKEPPSSTFDDETFFEPDEVTEEEPIEPLKQLPAPDEEDAGDDEWLTEREE